MILRPSHPSLIPMSISSGEMDGLMCLHLPSHIHLNPVPILRNSCHPKPTTTLVLRTLVSFHQALSVLVHVRTTTHIGSLPILLGLDVTMVTPIGQTPATLLPRRTNGTMTLRVKSWLLRSISQYRHVPTSKTASSQRSHSTTCSTRCRL